MAHKKISSLPDNAKTTMSKKRIEELINSNKPAAAKSLCHKLCRKNPDDPQIWFLMSAVHAQLSEFNDAERCCREVIRRIPDFATAHYNRAIALQQLNQPEKAAACFREATRLQPDFVSAYIHLGDALKTTQQLGDACNAYNAALLVSPTSREALDKLAYTQLLQGDDTAALESYRKITSLDAKDVSNWILIAKLLASRGELDMAENACKQGLANNPDNIELTIELGKIMHEKGAQQEAGALLLKAKIISPENIEINYLLSNLEQNTVSYKDKQAYIAKVFDDYADAFDTHLVKQLEYHIPEQIRQLMHKVSADHPAGKLDILDLGCGTGQCGLLFQDISNKLTGVDLSARMIEKARQRRVYDELRVADIIDVLEEFDENTYDCIVAADVFIYVGSLAEVFPSCQKVLRDNGLFTFSVEDISGDAYRLRASGRFGHSNAYIHNLADSSGFDIREVHETMIRKEGTKHIPGRIFVLEKR